MAWEDAFFEDDSYKYQSVNEDPQYDPTSRGFLSGPLSSAARGAVDVAKGIGAGLEILGIDNPLYSGAKELEKEVDFLKPDIPEYFKTESALVRGAKSIPRNVVGGAGLAIAGGLTGGIPGAIIGGATNLGLNMGLGTYKESYDQYLIKNPGQYEAAKDYGISQAVPEVLGELASDLIAGGLLVQTGGLSLAGKEGVKATVRELLKAPVKEIAKTAGIGAGIELLTEEGTYISQEIANKSYGMGEGVTAEGLIETGVATAGMSMLFGGVAAKHSYNQNKTLNAAMNSGDLNMQKRAADIIYNTLEKSGDKDLASAWKTYTDTQFDLGKPIYMNDKFVEIGKQIEASKTYEVKDILSSDPTQQRESADSLLRKAGIDVDGSLIGPYRDVENEDFAIMQRDSLLYNQERNIGTKETRRQREILEGRQEIERRQAERDALVAGLPLTDPLVTLNNLYKDQLIRTREEDKQVVKDKRYSFYNDLLDSKNALLELNQDEIGYQEEREAKQFEEVASRYTKDKNQVRVIADLLQSPDDQLKLKMFQLMQELEPDSSNVSPEFINQLQEEANTQAKKNADKGNLTLENYLRKKEADRRGRGIGDLGYTMSEEDRAALAQAKKIVTKGIKGSAQVEKAKATIQNIEAKAAPQVQAVTQTPLVSEPTRSTEEATPTPTNPDEYTREDTQLPGVGTGVEENRAVAATLTTPEDILRAKEATQAVGVDEGVADAETTLKAQAERLDDPVLMAFFNEDYSSIPDMLKDDQGRLVKKSQMLDALINNHLVNLGRETVLEYDTYISGLIRKANESFNTQLTKEVEGAKATDAITWNAKENRSAKQTGTTEAGEKVEILKSGSKQKDAYDIIVNGELKDTVVGRVNARQAAEQHVTPKEKKTTIVRRRKGEVVSKGQVTAQDILKGNEVKVQEVPEGIEVQEENPDKETPEEIKQKVEQSSEVKKLDGSKFKVIKDKDGKTRVVEISEESNFTPEEIDQYLNEIREDARMYFLDNKGDRKATIQAVKAAGYDGVSEGLILDHIETMQYRTADDVISNVLNNVSPKSLEGQLAKFLKMLMDKSGKGNTSVIYDTLRTTSSYTSWGDGGIFLNDKQNYTVALHEVWHAIVNKGLEASPALRSEVVKVMNQVEVYIKKTDPELYKIVQEMREKNITTSRQFKDYYGYNDFNGKRELAYAMLNPKEFLAQVGNSKQVGDFYSKIELTEKRKGIIRTALDFIKESILNIFGKSQMYMNALEKVLDISQQLSQVEVSNSKSIGEVSDADLSKQEEKAERRERFLDKGIEEVKKIQDTPNRKEQVIEFFKKTEKGISKAFQPIYDATHNILPSVARKLRNLDRTENEKITSRTESILPFYRKFRKLSEHAQAELSFLLQNYDVEGVKERVQDRLTSWGNDSKTQDIYKDFLKVIDTLEEIKNDADVASLLKFNLVDNYFPRKIKDYHGLVAYLRNRSYYEDSKKLIEKKDIKGLEEYLKKNNLYDEVEDYFEKSQNEQLLSYLKDRYDWGTFDEAIKEAEEKASKNGKSFTDQDRAEVIGKIIASGRKPSAFLRTPTGVKKRSISRINPAMMKFYYDPMDALSMHIREMTSRIEINKMLGITKNNKLMQEFEELSKKLDTVESQKEKDKIEKRMDDIFNEIPDVDKIVDESIGHLIAQESKNKKLSQEEQDRLTEIIRARITTKHMSNLTSLIRQGALLGSLTQIGTGIRNLTDSINFMYASGMMNTLQAAMHVASKKALVKDIPFDFYQPLKEFSTTSRWTDYAMKASGLYYVDAFFKETGMEAAIIKAKQQTTEQFVNTWKERYGEKEAATLHKFITDEKMDESGKLPESVREFLYDAIADWQPVGLTEMPETYNRMGDGRLMYFLKSYSIKQANNFYRESIKKIRNGERAQGLKNLAHLGLLFMIAGASTDWLVDWINGREPDFSDSMLDTLLTLGLSSRYTLEKGKKEGILRSHLYNIIPPTGLIEYPLTDLIDLLSGDSVKGKTLKLVPGGGAWIYNNLTEAGKKAIINDSKRRVYEDIKDNNKVDYERIRRINREVIDFNKRFTPEEKMKPITPGTITSIKRREQEKKRKGK